MTTMAEVAGRRGAAVAYQHRAASERENAAKNILLFFAAPWIGLGYIIAFPFVGWAALLGLAFRTKT